MNKEKTCPSCQTVLPADWQFCSKCGTRLDTQEVQARAEETLNLRILYIMVGLLILAVLFPPWEAGPGEPPQFLGLSFILSPPREGAVVSRMLQTIQLVTIAVGGMYGSWLFRSK